MLGFLLCGCPLEILTNFWMRSPRPPLILQLVQLPVFTLSASESATPPPRALTARL